MRNRKPTSRYGAKTKDSTPIDEVVDDADDLEKDSTISYHCVKPSTFGPRHIALANSEYWVPSHSIVGDYAVPRPKTYKSAQQRK